MPAGDSFAHRIIGAGDCTDEGNASTKNCGCNAGTFSGVSAGGFQEAVKKSVAQPCGAGANCATKYEYDRKDPNDPNSPKKACTLSPDPIEP